MNNPSETPPDLPKNISEESKTLYLKEALKLSETTIAEQNSAFATIDRKAILLVTLYVAIIAFLLSWKYDSDEKMIILISYTIIVVLIIAALVGLGALYTRPFAVPGASPKYLMRKDFNHNLDKMSEDLLNVCNDRFNLNKTILTEKLVYSKISLRLGVAGIFLTSVWVILVFSDKLGIMIMPL